MLGQALPWDNNNDDGIRAPDLAARRSFFCWFFDKGGCDSGTSGSATAAVSSDGGTAASQASTVAAMGWARPVVTERRVAG